MPVPTTSVTRLSAAAFERLREQAIGLGLGELGAVPLPALRLAEARARALPGQPATTGLPEWLAAGRHATMEWMATSAPARESPVDWWPPARTALVAVLAHDGPGEPGDGPTPDGAGGPRGRLARYAFGRDYHLVLRALLVRLGRVLEREAPGARWRLAVDSHPVMEKPMAVLAGLGWIGKHGNLIRAAGSSWWFLGVLLTSAELDRFEPFTADHCGTCTACLDACPTGAIVAPQVVDAGRCVSYLTIERRDAAPVELRPGQGSWVFGCDACQDACPWNRHRTREGHPRFAPGPLGRGPALRDLLRLDRPAFTAATPKSAIKRAGRDGLVKSAAVAAGNSGDRDLVPALADLLLDPSPAVRCHAAWALGRLGGVAARAVLERHAGDADDAVRAEVAAARSAAS